MKSIMVICMVAFVLLVLAQVMNQERIDENFGKPYLN
jgi:hypothetical protein